MQVWCHGGGVQWKNGENGVSKWVFHVGLTGLAAYGTCKISGAFFDNDTF